MPAATLKMICTPIGNLGDMSPRAIEAIKSCGLILSEDTRHSLRLLNLLGVCLEEGVKVVSCPQAKELQRLELALEHLSMGKNVAFLSDAGAPGISDPGGRLVEGITKAGYTVEVFPGASALIGALMGAGIISHRFSFLGFLPRKGKDRQNWVKTSIEMGLAVVLLESPFRIKKMLEELYEWCGPRRVVVARELTKKFETFHRGTLGSSLDPVIIEKGEMVVVVEGE